jgi:hypothetical protein
MSDQTRDLKQGARHDGFFQIKQRLGRFLRGAARDRQRLSSAGGCRRQ